ncbi:POL5 [Sanghuangporus weigelae]
MAAVTTTLPLFWHLSSANKGERIDASVKLVAALQQFKENRSAETSKKLGSGDETEEEEEDGSQDKEDDEVKTYSSKLDSDNAPDVAYAVRRLIRGLASPRESSRLGFAVALTEILSRIDTVTCEQILVLLWNASQTSGSMSGQEERDMLFARLFGLKCIVQSGLLFNQKPLRLSSTGSSSLKGFEIFLTELLELGEKKSWLRESCWWTLLSAVNALSKSSVPWKEKAYDFLFDCIYVKDKTWSPEKVALTLNVQKTHRDADWEAICGTYFKGSDLLSTSNLPLLGRLLKTSFPEGVEDDAAKHAVGPWKPQLHFVWDVILNELLPTEGSTSSGSFQDFYRIVVDETLFSSSSSPQRKYWGFLVFQKALHRVPTSQLPMLFTKNFMRTWINQLAKDDRYLHRIARQVTSDVQSVAEKDPKAGFTLVLQLTGTNGSYQFDRITKTKTVETILSSTDSTGIKEYMSFLFKQVNGDDQGDSPASIDSRRMWVIDQLSTLIRKGSIPKTDEDIQIALEWLATHGFFKVVKTSSNSENDALHNIPDPSFSDEIRTVCRNKLLACLGDLTSVTGTVDTSEDKGVKVPGVTSDGEFWTSKVLKTIIELEKDSKHVELLHHLEDNELEVRNRVLSLIKNIKASRMNYEAARGAELLLGALVLKCLSDGEDKTGWEDVKECTEQFAKLLLAPDAKAKKKRREPKRTEIEDKSSDRPPLDLVVDVIIGLLENSTSFTRVISDQSFGMLASLVTDSTVDLILAQLERRDPNEDVMEEDDESDDDSEDSENPGNGSKGGTDDDGTGSTPSSDNDEEEDLDDEGTEALRKALQATVSGKEDGEDGEESDISLDASDLDDEQMMVIDEKLAAVFRERSAGRRKGRDVGAQREATYFKNRVLDLVETYMKRQPSSRLILRFILPLVELVATSSSDEKQLSDKAKGILRSRLSKTKDAPAIDDTSKEAELLESLHLRARKAHSQDTVSIISICSLFVTKALIINDERTVLRIYKESITDFFTHKASSLNPAFIVDFIRRHPHLAWSIRSRITEALGNSVNGYRQSQAFSILQTVLTSLPQPEAKKDEILAFTSEMSKSFLDVSNRSCVAEKPLMNSAHMKQALKVVLSLVRFTKRFCTNSAKFEEAWRAEEWGKLSAALSSSEHFKASTSLASTCQQISKLIRLVGQKNGESSSKSARKRKQDVEAQGVEEDEPSSRKPKRKKVRKAPKTADS